MKSHSLYWSLSLVLFLLYGVGCGSKSETKSANLEEVEETPLKSQLKVFEQLGFTLNAGVDENTILAIIDENKLKSDDFSMVYQALGSQMVERPWGPITNQCWYLDKESVIHYGDYVGFIRNLERISGGELIFEHEKYVVDNRSEHAAVSFELQGDVYHWRLITAPHQLETNLFPRIIELTQKIGTKGRFTHLRLDEGTSVIGWATEDQLKKLKQETGLAIEWLK